MIDRYFTQNSHSSSFSSIHCISSHQSLTIGFREFWIRRCIGVAEQFTFRHFSLASSLFLFSLSLIIIYKRKHQIISWTKFENFSHLRSFDTHFFGLNIDFFSMISFWPQICSSFLSKLSIINGKSESRRWQSSYWYQYRNIYLFLAIIFSISQIKIH
jgi:hypothetical protein